MKHTQSVAPAANVPVELTLEGTAPGIFALYSWKNLLFVIWFAPAVLESIAIFDHLNTAARERHPEGVSFIHVMVPGHFNLPSSETRAAYAAVAKRHLDWIAATAVVIPGDGFWASAIRGMITALRVLSPREVKLRLHASPDESADWLPAVHSETTGVLITASELRRALLQLKRAQAAQIS